MKVSSPVAAVLLLACSSSISYNYDWARDEDMAKYRTFDWITIPSSAPDDVPRMKKTNDHLRKRIKRTVGSRLEAKGYKQDSSHPDFVILFHFGSEDKIRVIEWGYRYGPGPWGPRERDIRVRQYTRGSLILDFVDSEKNTLFWRGEARTTINPDTSQEELDRRLNEVIAGLLRNFPPKN